MFKDRVFYGWVVVAAFFFVGAILLGIRLSFGVFFKSLASEFDLSRTETSLVFSVYMVLGCIFTFFAGRALDRYGPRIVVFLIGLTTGIGLLLTSQTTALWQLFITYSLLLSIGNNSIYVVTMATVQRWFDKRLGLALSIAGSGAGLGMMIIAPFAAFIIMNFGWRTAYIVLGLFAWIFIIPISNLLKRAPSEIGTLPTEEAITNETQLQKKERESIEPVSLSLLHALKTRNFWLLMFNGLLFAMCLFLISTHLVPYAMDMGIPANKAATLLSLMGGIGLAGRVPWGLILDRLGRKWAAIVCALLQAAAMLLLIWTQELWMLYMFAAIYGFSYMSNGFIIATLVGQTFGLGELGGILGMLGVGFGIGAGIGPVLGGIIFDIDNNYFWAFLIGSVAMLVSALLIALVRQETSKGIFHGMAGKF